MYSMTSLLVFGGSLQFDSRPLLDALESACRNIPAGVRHRNPSASRRVFELLMTSSLIHLVPTSLQQPLYDLPAVHHSAFPRYAHNTHFIHTTQACTLLY